jgi:hypothetical protein
MNRIEYIRKDIPGFEAPAYPGKCCQVLVPDTLDLQERAGLVINGLTGPTDPETDYEMYFYVYFERNKPVMSHDISSECPAGWKN